MRFLVDNQLPPALARFIREDLAGEALHVADIGLRSAADKEIWTYASENAMILITKDEDFVNLFSQAPTAGLLWVRLGNVRRAFLLSVFQRVWQRITERFASGERFVELR